MEFKLPEVSEGVESADVAEILVSEGDVIEAEQNVMEIETDKAVVELPCPHAGKITKIHVSAGDTVEVGSVLLTIEQTQGAEAGEGGEPGPQAEAQPAEEQEQPASREPSGNGDEQPERAPEQPERTREPAPQATNGSEAAALPTHEPHAAPRSATTLAHTDRDDRVPPPAGPATRRLARQLGVDLHNVQGSNRGGRIDQEDVKAYVRQITSGEGGPPATVAKSEVAAPMAAPELPDFTRFGNVERERLNKVARTAAQNLAYSWSTIPHVTQHDLADVTDLESARKQYMATTGKGGPKITMTALVTKAVVSALKAFPRFNSSLDLGSGELVLKKYYHIGMAVDTENGLIVPVVKDADRKSVVEIAAEISELAGKARDRKIAMDDLQGATFTITNLGGIGGTAFTPIVNFPEVAILGMSRAQKQLRLEEDGSVTQRLMLPLSLSYDHRVVNGADAARFIVKLSHSLADFFELVVEG